MLIALILGPTVAMAEPKSANAPRVQGLFGAVVCEEQQTTNPVCTSSCTTWAGAQPNFQMSFDACVSTCRKQFPCAGR
jgi:hypothetical protein